MQFPLSSIRILLYTVLIVFAFIVLVLAGARLYHTTHLVHIEPVNEPVNFYESIVAELLTTALLTIGWSIFVIHTIYKRLEVAHVGTFLGELLGLALLFLFWIVGASIASSAWGDVSLCISSACQVLAGLLAFAWLSWIVIVALLVMSFMFALANKAWNEPLHGRWDPRVSHYHG